MLHLSNLAALYDWVESQSPHFDPNHDFLSSIEIEIITFLPKKAAIFFFLLLRLSLKSGIGNSQKNSLV